MAKGGAPGPVVAVVQARMTSTRLPGKVLKPLAGAPLIRRMIERMKRINGVDRVVLALAEGAHHDPVIAALNGLDVAVVRGPEVDVLARTAMAVREYEAGTVMRVTSDCPLVEPSVSASVLAAYSATYDAGIRYARTAFETGFPMGFDTEVISATVLFEAETRSTDPYEREHVTPYIWRRSQDYPAVLVDARPDRRHWRLVVDTEDDYRLASAIYDALYPQKPDFGDTDLCRLFETRSDLLAINAHIASHRYNGLR
jgi:spore coat polysaccharide biosynthesis protein SpsF